ncbi:MAG: hypothetical protein MZW92_18835 [Comamonadaceae bacterium]|nr:hypothetical protein [Comamonadaceae bacterium]
MLRRADAASADRRRSSSLASMRCTARMFEDGGRAHQRRRLRLSASTSPTWRRSSTRTGTTPTSRRRRR